MPHLPVLFVSHGAPDMLLRPDPARDFLVRLGQELARPRAILCVSAHWEAARPTLSAASSPDTVHDFFGFPDALYDLRYPAPGDPRLAQSARDLLEAAGIGADLHPSRGLDHGVWSPLSLMYPDAHIPVVSLALSRGAGTTTHWAMGQALQPLRDQGVLILASGGATHNLRDVGRHGVDAPPVDYAYAFDTWLEDRLRTAALSDLLDYRARAPHAARNHPSEEHLLPLFVALGAAPSGAAATRLYNGFSYGVLSMAAYGWD
jgi:4,5-DOPA dioxygenase extradiol